MDFLRRGCKSKVVVGSRSPAPATRPDTLSLSRSVAEARSQAVAAVLRIPPRGSVLSNRQGGACVVLPRPFGDYAQGGVGHITARCGA